MTDCVLDIHHWSSSHRLKLNACKSEVVWLGTRQQLTRLSHDDKVLELSDGALQPSTTVKNPGVHLDDTLTMDDDAKQCVRTCFFHMHRIHQLRRFIDDNTMHTLVPALIVSRLDYCNSLYAGCTISTLHRLQRLQDATARLLCGASPLVHAHPLLQQLHWLQCRQSYSIQTMYNAGALQALH